MTNSRKTRFTLGESDKDFTDTFWQFTDHERLKWPAPPEISTQPVHARM